MRLRYEYYCIEKKEKLYFAVVRDLVLPKYKLLVVQAIIRILFTESLDLHLCEITISGNIVVDLEVVIQDSDRHQSGLASNVAKLLVQLQK